MNKKTKKILLLISTILTLLIGIANIFAIYIGELELEAAGDVMQLSYTAQLLILGICSLVNLISIVFIAKDFVIYKKKLIILNVVQLLLGTIFNIISAIINIVLL